MSDSKGIDFTKALEILSSRSAETHSHVENECHHNSLPDGSKQLGQVIDLTADNKRNEEIATSEEWNRKQLEQTRAKGLEEIIRELNTMRVPKLLRTLLEAQHQRVATYKFFDSGLETALQTHNLSIYPTICANATASFSVLSDAINAIQHVFVDRNRTDLKDMVASLQAHEQQKLNLTAALHLEQIRIIQSVEGNERTTHLLREGVRSLQTKVADCVESINDALEEIRCVLVDEEENEP